jgi:hypothetical protein
MPLSTPSENARWQGTPSRLSLMPRRWMNHHAANRGRAQSGQTALLKLNNQPRCLHPAPATPHYKPSRFTHATSPPQQQYREKVWLLLRVPVFRPSQHPARSELGPLSERTLSGRPCSPIRRSLGFCV